MKRFPEAKNFFGSDVERPAPRILVGSSGPHSAFVRALGDAMQVQVSDSLGNGLTLEVMEGPLRVAEFAGGRCACGRASLVLSRCRSCIQADAALADEAAWAAAPRSDDRK